MSKMNKWKIYNRKFLVDRFQLRLVGVAAVHFLLVVVIFATALFAPIVIRLESDDITSPAVQAAAREFLVLHTTLWAPLLGAFILLVLHNIVVSHRIAGPLYRFRLYFKTVGKGDLSTPLRVRKNDYLQKEAAAVNDMVTSLRDKIARLEKQLGQTTAAWSDMRHELARGVASDPEAKTNAMARQLEDCRASLAVFDIGKEHAVPAEVTGDVSKEPIKIKV